jgi:excinuclease ABC subunit C
MRAAVADLAYERAAGLRDKIAALEKTVERQVISASHHLDQDVFALARQGEGCAVAVLLIRDGLINGQHAYFIPHPLDDGRRLLAEVLARFYEQNPVPAELVLPMKPAGLGTLTEWLVEQRQGRVRCRVPQRGDLTRLIAMADRNARQVFVERAGKKESWQDLGDCLRRELQLPAPPIRISCIDISNIGGSQTVGSVVNFYQGRKEAARYRHYKLNRPDGRPDDYASMAETMARHLRRAAADDYMPDLLLVDGGKGQLNVARRILADLGMDGLVELAGIAKEKGTEGEKIYRPGRRNPLNLAGNSEVLLLLMRIRDEAHRFGITFHRKWRQKEAMASPLDKIAGIGPAKKRTLLKTMGSLQRIKEASPAELAAAPGIGPELARKILHTLRRSSGGD